MNLLPKLHTEFTDKDYWDKFFVHRGNKAFEWYGEYPELCGILHKYVRPTDQILMVGCGNSKLSADIYDVGCRNVTNIDVSDIVIRQMTNKHKTARPQMKWLKMDATQMTFDDNFFSVVLDKGTLDALMPDDLPDTIENINKFFTEIHRVLKVGGRYVCISLLQEHILQHILKHFTAEGWMFRLHHCADVGSANFANKQDAVFPVFMIVMTKFKKLEGMQQILEINYDYGNAQRVKDAGEVIQFVKNTQQFSFLRHNLNKKNVARSKISVDLYSPDSDKPRYHLYIVDRVEKSNIKFAIFLVPQGREKEWIFGSPEGRHHLAESASCGRLIVVTLNPNHTFENADVVKNELSEKVMDLAPPGLPSDFQTPFLSAGDDSLNGENVLYKGHSELSGYFEVKDVEGSDQKMFRQLIFLSNNNVVQSEAKLKYVIVKKKKHKKGKWIVDHSFLACQHHSLMIGGIALIPNVEVLLDSSLSILIIGLGGGGLPMFIRQHFPKVSLDVVDIDEAIVSVSKEWFGFVEDDRIKVHVKDGLEFIQQAAQAGNNYNVVMLDVDSKDLTLGMSCPPKPFVEMTNLNNIKAILPQQGVLCLNLVCRDTKLKKQTLDVLKELFPVVYCVEIEEEVNVVVYCLKDNSVPTQIPSGVTAAANTLNKMVEEISEGVTLVNIDNLMQNLKLV